MDVTGISVDDMLASQRKKSFNEAAASVAKQKGAKTLVRERRLEKQRQAEAAKAAEENKYADLPEWKRAMMLRKDSERS